MLLLIAVLGGCANSTAPLSMMSALDEMTTGSKNTSNYLPVGDLPESHQVLMTAVEQSNARKELIVSRDEAALKAAQQQRDIDAWLRSRTILPDKRQSRGPENSRTAAN
jgi:hypothetical protein